MSATMHKSGSRRRQRGVAAIEMAITLPVLLFMLLAIAEFGRAFHQYNTLSKAVHSATRYLSTTALDGFKTIDLTDAKEHGVSREHICLYRRGHAVEVKVDHVAGHRANGTTMQHPVERYAGERDGGQAGGP